MPGITLALILNLLDLRNSAIVLIKEPSNRLWWLRFILFHVSRHLGQRIHCLIQHKIISSYFIWAQNKKPKIRRPKIQDNQWIAEIYSVCHNTTESKSDPTPLYRRTGLPKELQYRETAIGAGCTCNLLRSRSVKCFTEGQRLQDVCSQWLGMTINGWGCCWAW